MILLVHQKYEMISFEKTNKNRVSLTISLKLNTTLNSIKNKLKCNQNRFQLFFIKTRCIWLKKIKKEIIFLIIFL